MSGGYHVQMYGRRPDPESTLIYLCFTTMFLAFGTIFITVLLVADLRGGNATATVVNVRSQEFYTISYVTRDGTHCRVGFKSFDRPERIHLYDSFQVHYPSMSPCVNFRRADDRSLYSFYPIVPILLVASVVGLLVRRGRRFRRDRDDWFRVRHF
jgi:hypothetical protein